MTMLRKGTFGGTNVFLYRSLVPPELFDALDDALNLNSTHLELLEKLECRNSHNPILGDQQCWQQTFPSLHACCKCRKNQIGSTRVSMGIQGVFLVSDNMLLANFSRMLKMRCTGFYSHWSLAYSSLAQETEAESLPMEWYKATYAKMIKLSCILNDVENIDGRTSNISSNLIVTDSCVIGHMQTFNALANAFIGLRSQQRVLKQTAKFRHFSKPEGRNSVVLKSLTKVCDILNISAQQRLSVRLKVCPQVTQYHIWKESLEEVLKDLKYEMESLGYVSPTFQMAKQIISSSFIVFRDTTELSTAGSPPWMRPPPLKKVENTIPPRNWLEVLEIFKDLSKCLEQEEMMAYHVSKLEAMMEGLYHIKDLLVERDISYKEIQRQECLVQKKLTKNLGHSSKCLFTLLLYYLHASVRDIKLEICGELYSSDGKFYLCVGKVAPSCHEEAIWNAVKQLNRALIVFEFVWQSASKREILKLQGYIWSLGAEERTLTYRGNVFHVLSLKL